MSNVWDEIGSGGNVLGGTGSARFTAIPPSHFTPGRIAEYHFLSANLITQVLLGEVKMSSFYWDTIYNRPGSGLGTTKLEFPTTTKENFDAYKNSLWAVKEGQIVYGGIMGKVQRRGGTQVLSVPVIGFLEYFRRRLLRGIQGMTYATLEKGSQITWTNVDQFRIFKDMIDHAQSFTYGNVGVNVQWSALSGKQMTVMYEDFEQFRIGQLLEELMAPDDGFQIEYTYGFDSGRPQVTFNLVSPKWSVLLDYPLLYQDEVDITETVNLTSAMDLNSGTSDYADGGNATNATGDLEVMFTIMPDDWTPASINTIRAKDGGAGNISWRFELLTTGQLRLTWSTDGTATTSESSGSSVSFTNGERGTVRVSLIADNGLGNYEVAFFESDDGGATWTNLGTGADDVFESTFASVF